MDYFVSANLKVHTVTGHPFLIVEPTGNLTLETYQSLLLEPEIEMALKHAHTQLVYLELNGVWTIGTDQQTWTVGGFQAHLRTFGVQKMAIGLAEHVYPTFAMLAEMYEATALMPTKYFADLAEMAAWLR